MALVFQQESGSFYWCSTYGFLLCGTVITWGFLCLLISWLYCSKVRRSVWQNKREIHRRSLFHHPQALRRRRHSIWRPPVTGSPAVDPTTWRRSGAEVAHTWARTESGRTNAERHSAVRSITRRRVVRATARRVLTIDEKCVRLIAAKKMRLLCLWMQNIRSVFSS